MNMHRWLGALCIAVLSLSGTAFAVDGHKAPTLEIAGSTSGNFNLILGSTTSTTTTISGSVGFFVSPQLQIVGTPTLAVTTGGTSLTAFGLYGGVNYSFSPDIDSAFYVGAAPGLIVASAGGSSTTNFSYFVSLGKRFPVVGSVAYTPQISYVGTTGATYTSAIAFVPMAFSFLL